MNDKPTQYESFREYMEKEGNAKVEIEIKKRSVENKGHDDRLKSLLEYMRNEIKPELEKRDLKKIESAENELAEFQRKYQKFADSKDAREKQYFETGLKLRKEDLEFLRKYFGKESK